MGTLERELCELQLQRETFAVQLTLVDDAIASLGHSHTHTHAHAHAHAHTPTHTLQRAAWLLASLPRTTSVHALLTPARVGVGDGAPPMSMSALESAPVTAPIGPRSHLAFHWALGPKSPQNLLFI